MNRSHLSITQFPWTEVWPNHANQIATTGNVFGFHISLQVGTMYATPRAELSCFSKAAQTIMFKGIPCVFCGSMFCLAHFPAVLQGRSVDPQLSYVGCPTSINQGFSGRRECVGRKPMSSALGCAGAPVSAANAWNASGKSLNTSSEVWGLTRLLPYFWKAVLCFVRGPRVLRDLLFLFDDCCHCLLVSYS